MKKRILGGLCFVIIFFSIICFADTNTITVDKQVITVPSYEGFQFTSDPNSPEFKKLNQEVGVDDMKNHGFYYESTPSDLTKRVAIMSDKSIHYLTPSQWKKGINQLYDSSRNPIVTERPNSKSEQIVRETISNPLYTTFISELKVSIKSNRGNMFTISALEARTYINLNGKPIILQITIEGASKGISAYDPDTVNWAKTISDATAQRIIELNPPTAEMQKQAETAEHNEQRKHWRNIAWIIVGILSFLLSPYGFKYLPESVQNVFARRKKQLVEQEAKKKAKKQQRTVERQK